MLRLAGCFKLMTSWRPLRQETTDNTDVSDEWYVEWIVWNDVSLVVWDGRTVTATDLIQPRKQEDICRNPLVPMYIQVRLFHRMGQKPGRKEDRSVSCLVTIRI